MSAQQWSALTMQAPAMEKIHGDDPVLTAALEAAGLPVDDLVEPGRHCFRFADGDKLVGFIGGELNDDGSALLRSLVVMPSERGKGAGRAMVSWALARLAELGTTLSSRSARTTAESSSSVPPAYIIATTAAVRFALWARAAIMKMSAMTSTLIRPAERSRTMDTTSAAITGASPAAQIQFVALVAPSAWREPGAECVRSTSSPRRLFDSSQYEQCGAA
jgi:GNAT superfamily N-acetyltransferase